MTLDRLLIIRVRAFLFMAGMAAAALPVLAQKPEAIPGTFAENPIVYFVMTDRFFNGNPANDHAKPTNTHNPKTVVKNNPKKKKKK
jgi:hypothetical protein